MMHAANEWPARGWNFSLTPVFCIQATRLVPLPGTGVLHAPRKRALVVGGNAAASVTEMVR